MGKHSEEMWAVVNHDDQLLGDITFYRGSTIASFCRDIEGVPGEPIGPKHGLDGRQATAWDEARRKYGVRAVRVTVTWEG